MNIAITTDSFKMPNIALMKIATHHKLKGDTVSWHEPLFNEDYDKIYYSKIFTFTKYNPYINGNIEGGGTGLEIKKTLPSDIDKLPCDYTLYPNIDYSIGFITRGCIRNCDFCIVPQKEGTIYPYSSVAEIVKGREHIKKIILLDNNILASDYGLSQIEHLTNSNYKVDFNQGLDARLITTEIAQMLAKIKYINYIKVSCDTDAMVQTIASAYDKLRLAGYKKELFCYVLIKDFKTGYKRIQNLLTIGNITPFVQPYRDFENKVKPEFLSKELSRWCNRVWIRKACSFDNYLQNRRYKHLLADI